MMEPGFYKISNEKYHSGAGVSRSFLWRLETETPLDALIPVKETDDMKFGNDFHCAVLEPVRFDKEYITVPEDCLIGSGKGQRIRLAEFMEKVETQGLSILKPADLEKIKRMREAVFSHPLASELLSNGQSEISGFWYDPVETDILCKLRMDFIIEFEHIIVDLKKTADANPEHPFFKNTAYRLGYDMEAHWYLYGATQITRIEHKEFKFIASEDHEPWKVQVYPADEELKYHGNLRCSRAFNKYVECFRSGEWPGLPPEEVPLSLPGWVRRQEGYGSGI